MQNATCPMPQTMSEQRDIQSAFLAALKENGIPPCPAVLVQVGAEMRKDDPDLRRLADFISADVAIAGGVLKTANSPFFGTRRRVATVMDALILLGLDTTSQAVACVALHEAFPNFRGMDRFWDASAKIARLSGALAQLRRWPGVRPQDAYTYGLFRDCGIAVLLQRFSERYIDVLSSANTRGDRSFTEVEDEVMPANHAVVGAMLTQSWWLPEGICGAIRNHHDVAALDELGAARLGVQRASRTLIAVAQTAEYILQQKTGLSSTREWEKLGPACLQQLGLNDAELATLIEDSADAIAG